MIHSSSSGGIDYEIQQKHIGNLIEKLPHTHANKVGRHRAKFYPIALYAKIENSCKIWKALKKCVNRENLLHNSPILLQNLTISACKNSGTHAKS